MSLSPESIGQLDAFVRAANYLGAAQIYLRENTRLREPLRAEDIKPRLLGHWGTQPGLNLIYAHLSRLVRDTGQNAMLVVGPGHGAPAILGCLWLEGTLGETYPAYRRDGQGMARLIRDFSWPGGFPSHLTAMTPGAIHEGGELGYSLLHAFGAALDNPDLIVACVVGDGEAETGPLAASWHSPKFIDPARDGAVLPILHLNGVKLSGPTLFARMSSEELAAYFKGCGYVMREVAGEYPTPLHEPLADALDWARSEIRAIQARARTELRADLQRLAGDRAAHAQGHDRTAHAGRGTGGRHLPQPPGPDHGPAQQSRASARTAGVAAFLQARRAVRRRGPADPAHHQAPAAARADAGAQPARQWGRPPPEAQPARLGAARRPPRRARSGRGREHLGAGHLAARGIPRQRDGT